ncbi:hypothetical protein [Alkalihalobacterium alkalinitrilicum]|nr:hypothetical protein [Alkalihalobacterium alkalinitrilicum]
MTWAVHHHDELICCLKEEGQSIKFQLGRGIQMIAEIRGEISGLGSNLT